MDAAGEGGRKGEVRCGRRQRHVPGAARVLERGPWRDDGASHRRRMADGRPDGLGLRRRRHHRRTGRLARRTSWRAHRRRVTPGHRPTAPSSCVRAAPRCASSSAVSGSPARVPTTSACRGRSSRRRRRSRQRSCGGSSGRTGACRASAATRATATSASAVGAMRCCATCWASSARSVSEDACTRVSGSETTKFSYTRKDGTEVTYRSRQGYDLRITGSDLERFADRIGFSTPRKQAGAGAAARGHGALRDEAVRVARRAPSGWSGGRVQPDRAASPQLHG